jgi:peptide/nickel transport system substrate-binding protein
MKRRIIPFAAALLALATLAPRPGLAERVLRVTETTMGEADPQKPSDIPGSMLMINLYDFLVAARPGGGLDPSVAKSWTVSPDGLTYTFTLRNDVKFHDGTSLTAGDVVFTVQRMQALKRGAAFLFATVKDVQAVDPTTVRFTLTQPFTPFLAALVRLAILNQELVRKNIKPGPFGALGDYGQAFLSSTDAGSGPYRLTRQAPQEESVLQKFDGYFNGFAADAPDTVRLKFGNEATTVRALMARHELELTRPALPPEVLAALAKTPGVSLALDRQPQMFQFKLNMTRAPTDDLAFRKAIALGFDYDALYGLLNVAGIKAGSPARGPIPSNAIGYDPSVPIMHRDLAAAKQALAQSKYKPDQVELELAWTKEVPQEEKYALLFQQSMADLGIKVNIQSTPWAQFQQMAASNATTPNVSSIFVGLVTPDADSLLWPEYQSGAGGTYNSMGWVKNDEVDRLLEKGRVLTDEKARADNYRALARIVAATYPAVFGYNSATVVARQNYVHAPTLEEADKAVPILAGNYQFRTMSVTK